MRVLKVCFIFIAFFLFLCQFTSYEIKKRKKGVQSPEPAAYADQRQVIIASVTETFGRALADAENILIIEDECCSRRILSFSVFVTLQQEEYHGIEGETAVKQTVALFYEHLAMLIRYQNSTI